MTKPASNIDTWKGWPEDVRQKLWDLNRSRNLTFVWLGRPGNFTCVACLETCSPHRYGDAQLDGCMYCDDCLMKMVR